MFMHLPILIALIIVVILPDIWISYRLRHHHRHWSLHILYWLPSVLFILGFILLRTHGQLIDTPATTHKVAWFFSIFALIYVPKLLFVIFSQLNFLFHHITKKRTRIFTTIGKSVSLFAFILLLLGMTHTRTNLCVKEVEITHPDLPQSFDGLRIAHITDQHLGNFGDDTTFISKVVKVINQQHPDIICSTGDMVNNFGCELTPYISIWQGLNAPLGKYAVLGNHDYGDYTKWESPESRAANLSTTKQSLSESGFTLLLNQHVILTKNTDTLYIAGVENWGKPPFPQYGNLSHTIREIPDSAFTLLLSHDVSHWRGEIVGHDNLQLTLSGHTHAAQMGIYTKWLKFSPSSWIYDEWLGLYQEGNQYLYVNPGLGYIGMAIRIGISPEVTIITLRKDTTKDYLSRKRISN